MGTETGVLTLLNVLERCSLKEGLEGKIYSEKVN